MHVCVFVFDLLYVDGDSLVHLPLRQRRARLAAALPNLQPGHVQFATSMEFQPAAVSAAAAAAAADDDGDSADATVGTDPSISDLEAGVGDEARTRVVSSARSSDSLNYHDDKEVVVGGQRADNLAHGGGDINATDEAAAAAAAEAAADASGVQEEDQGLKSGIVVEGAADAEGTVSDLALPSTEDRIQEFLLESFAGGTEGLMLKALDVAAGYQPSKRSDSWIKLKRCQATAEQSLSINQSINLHFLSLGLIRGVNRQLLVHASICMTFCSHASGKQAPNCRTLLMGCAAWCTSTFICTEIHASKLTRCHSLFASALDNYMR